MKQAFSSSLKSAALGLLGFSVGLGCLKAGTVLAQAWPNWDGEPLYGEIYLQSGFTPDPYSVEVWAGGSTNASSLGLGGDCTGFIAAEQPDFRLQYEAGSYPLSFLVESAADTTLVINGPDTGWYCNDDFNGVNPLVYLQRPSSGQYDIWIGNYGDTSTHEAILYITEYEP
ncbi:MAG: hypothetical protein VKI82_14625, partial [Leptolyngbya sp.]|nr:hypothetical protein [Leptolyngbya sp.]